MPGMMWHNVVICKLHYSTSPSLHIFQQSIKHQCHTLEEAILSLGSTIPSEMKVAPPYKLLVNTAYTANSRYTAVTAYNAYTVYTACTQWHICLPILKFGDPIKALRSDFITNIAVWWDGMDYTRDAWGSLFLLRGRAGQKKKSGVGQGGGGQEAKSSWQGEDGRTLPGHFQGGTKRP